MKSVSALNNSHTVVKMKSHLLLRSMHIKECWDYSEKYTPMNVRTVQEIFTHSCLYVDYESDVQSQETVL